MFNFSKKFLKVEMKTWVKYFFSSFTFFKTLKIFFIDYWEQMVFYSKVGKLFVFFILISYLVFLFAPTLKGAVFPFLIGVFSFFFLKYRSDFYRQIDPVSKIELSNDAYAYLKKEKINVNEDPQQLFISIKKNNFVLFKILFKKANKKTKHFLAKEGKLLHFAAKYSFNYDILNFLIECGDFSLTEKVVVDFYGTNSFSVKNIERTPLEVAVVSKNKIAINLLETKIGFLGFKKELEVEKIKGKSLSEKYKKLQVKMKKLKRKKLETRDKKNKKSKKKKNKKNKKDERGVFVSFWVYIKSFFYSNV